MAGKRLGKEDERHLWPEMLRAIREIQPRWVVGENVLGLVNWSGGLVFHEVQADLEAEGYEVQPYVLPACAVNAPHRRDRVWFVAKNTKRDGFVFGEPKKEGAEIRQFGNTCTGSSVGIHLSERLTHNPNGNPKGTPRQSTSTTGNRSNINVQQSEWGSETELNNRPSSIPRNATHPNGNGLNQRNGNYEEQSGEGGLDALNDINEVTMHTNGTSEQGKHIRQKREGKFNGPDSGDGFNNFQNFPTQSPICTRDDGLSTRLDGITFSKWRNESIKAGGNAIVPQVVYQIFKAIEQYEKG
jgi:DNA (cytosine-5)-methyltransferase 1